MKRGEAGGGWQAHDQHHRADFRGRFLGRGAIYGVLTGSVLMLGKWGHWSALPRAEDEAFYALGLWAIVAVAALWYVVEERRKR